MEKFNIVAKPLLQVVFDENGPAKSLCDTCKRRDCEEPVEPCKVSIMGVQKTIKLLCRGQSQAFVLGCNGFIK